MNDTTDQAFAPLDEADKTVGERADGTVTYKIVEGNTYLNGELVKPEVVGTLQIEEPKQD